MDYQAPIEEYCFLLDHVLDAGAIARHQPDIAMAREVLSEAARLAERTIAPLRRDSDLSPVRFVDGRIETSPGFAAAYTAFTTGGWLGLATAPELGGSGLPRSFKFCVDEMMAAGCLAFQMNPLLTQGAIEAIEAHGSPELRRIFLPRMVAGEWAGTMNLTEPQAGSDLAAVVTRAVPRSDGSYAVTGKKIFISWGDSDLCGNICHLVLARLPDAPEGTRGISLFLVPKIIPAELGGERRNPVFVTGIEKKLGLHGSPTCSMSFEGAVGWLLGEPNRGLAAMFTMMNSARLSVAMQGIGIAEAALQQARHYAQERRQPEPIIGFADIGHKLDWMAARIHAARALALDCALTQDMALVSSDPAFSARADLLTPLAKITGTEAGCQVADLAIQVFGGAGYIEESGITQFFRDVRVTTIYEGTNAIQALDLVGRKMADGGTAVRSLLSQIGETAGVAARTLPKLSEPLDEALGRLSAVSEALLSLPVASRAAVATDYAQALSLVLGAGYHLRSAMADPARYPLASFFVDRVLPYASAHLRIVENVVGFRVN